MYHITQFKIVKYVGLLFFLCSMFSVNAQQTESTNLFESFLPANYPLEGRAQHFYETYQNNPRVENVYLVKVNADLLDKNAIELRINEESSVARKLKTKQRKNKDFSWFGTLEDNAGIFFTIIDGKVGSKFYLGDYAYTLFPVEGEVHFLIEYHSIDIGYCGNSFDEMSESIQESIEHNRSHNRHLDDDDCNLRLLLAFTTNAEAEIATTLDVFAQIAVDETNLAYATSNINFEAEIAVTMRTTYTGSNGNFFLTDVINLRDGNGVLSAVHDMREVYNTDIQVLIRRHENNIWGRVTEVLTDANPADPDMGYCVVSVTGVTDGRFSFAHELAHLQGGRHENHNANPTSARGFVSGTGQNAWRTIVARTGAAPCNLTTSCRIQQFSNPAVNGPGGVPAGTATRNNALQLNNTRNDILAYRMTHEDLIVDNETIAAELISNHLANHTITTSNSVIASPNSLVTMRAGEEVLIQDGFVARNGSRFRAYIDNDPCEELPELRIAQEEDQEALAIDEKEVTLRVFPNPFSGETTIEYTLQEKGDVQITLLDAQGRFIKEVTRVLDQELGVYREKLLVDQLPDGIYLLKLQLNNSIKIERIMLMN